MVASISALMQHDVFAVLERFEEDARAEFHGPGGLDEHVDVLGPREQQGVFGRRPAVRR